MILAIFGGSFDPLHIGHIEIVKKALNELKIDKLLIVPTYINPFKKRFTAPANKRLEWLKKVFENKKKVEVIDFEIKQKRAVYTIETLLHLKSCYKNIEKTYLIIGADNLKNLQKWHKFEELKKQVTFVVATRKDTKLPKDLKKLSINVNISSTSLRDKIDENFLPKTLKDEIKKYYIRKKMEQRIENIVTILDNKKAENIQIFDMKDKDYFVEQVIIASTLGEKHGLALLDDLKKDLKDESFLNIDDDNEWIVIDLGDILIHLMTPEYRSKYNIEEFLSEREEEMKKLREMTLEDLS